MPVGDCQRAFGIAAARDGLKLRTGSLINLTDAGHLERSFGQSTRQTLASIFEALGGDEAGLAAGSHRPLPLDWLAHSANLIVEIDEEQHFTSDRLKTLKAYPADVAVAFSVPEYITLCEVLSAGSDRYRVAKPARGFQWTGGRRAQRAYFDAVKDLGAPEIGWRVFRVPAAHQDGVRAYAEVRTRLRALMSE